MQNPFAPRGPQSPTGLAKFFTRRRWLLLCALFVAPLLLGLWLFSSNDSRPKQWELTWNGNLEPTFVAAEVYDLRFTNGPPQPVRIVYNIGPFQVHRFLRKVEIGSLSPSPAQKQKR